MGKASSAKKVAKAARAGGRSSGASERNLLFPGLIIAIFVAGIALVAFARSEHQSAASTVEPRNFESHWHAAYGIYICDDEVPDADFHEYFENPTGIHSHQDGALHVHPTSRQAAGENATLGVYLDGSPRLDLSDDRIELNDETWEEGVDTCEVDGEEVPGEVVVAVWDNVVDDDEDSYAIVESGFRDLRFRQDREGYMIAFVPEGEHDDIPKPRSAEIIPSISQSLDDILPGDADQDFLEELDPYEDDIDFDQFEGETEIPDPDDADGDADADNEDGESDEPAPVGPELPGDS